MIRDILLALALLFSFIVTAQNIDPKKLDQFIDHIEANNQGIGEISIFQKGKEVYKRSFGQKAVPGLKWNTHTKYQFGSVTKVFTATLIWKLIEQGKLSLTDKLADFYPQLPNAKKITIKNLLEHTSGIKRDYSLKPENSNWLREGLVSDEAIMAEIQRQGVDFEPGDSSAYSNSAFYLLKNIIEKKSGQSYGGFLKQQIIKPNRLKDLQSADMNPKNTFLSYAFDYAADTWQVKEDYVYSNILGVGDIAATPTDMNQFFYNLFHHKIVKAETLAQMIPAKNEPYGRNLYEINFYKEVLYGHGGDTRGTHSLVVYDPKTEMSLAVSINGTKYPHNDFYLDILRIIYTGEVRLPYFISKSESGKYTGIYVNKEAVLRLNVFVHKEWGLMCEDVVGESMYPLYPYAPGKFRFDELDIKMEFKDSQLFFAQAGVDLILTREPTADK
ncbi:serine hydrolase domain-containing protein [Terrimonas ferruginea]|uniref:serine hydrolase domain-containing protein n=1 Tax=Terrimonas ferruginea TaxID=249 RepID=UPI0003FD4D58|nr:serine hydrolase domain-containing protein [Terrimonas ferruginea]